MKNFKKTNLSKLLTVLLALSMVFVTAALFTGCGNSGNPAESGQPDQSDQPQSPETETVMLYLPDDNAEYLLKESVECEAGDAAIVAALVEKGALPEGCMLNSSSLEGTVLNVDMNAAYGQAAGTTGTAGELMLIYSLVNTLAEANGADSVNLTIDGNILETGHNIYEDLLVPDAALVK